MSEKMKMVPSGTPTPMPMIAPIAHPVLNSSSNGSLLPPPEKMVDWEVGALEGAVIVGSVRRKPAWLQPSTTSTSHVQSGEMIWRVKCLPSRKGRRTEGVFPA